MDRHCKIFKNGAKVKLNNKRIEILERSKDSFVLKFKTLSENAHEPAVIHKHKGKVRESYIGLTAEAIEALLHAYVRYQDFKEK